MISAQYGRTIWRLFLYPPKYGPFDHLRSLCFAVLQHVTDNGKSFSTRLAPKHLMRMSVISVYEGLQKTVMHYNFKTCSHVKIIKVKTEMKNCIAPNTTRLRPVAQYSISLAQFASCIRNTIIIIKTKDGILKCKVPRFLVKIGIDKKAAVFFNSFSSRNYFPEVNRVELYDGII